MLDHEDGVEGISARGGAAGVLERGPAAERALCEVAGAELGCIAVDVAGAFLSIRNFTVGRTFCCSFGTVSLLSTSTCSK